MHIAKLLFRIQINFYFSELNSNHFFLIIYYICVQNTYGKWLIKKEDRKRQKLQVRAKRSRGVARQPSEKRGFEQPQC